MLDCTLITTRPPRTENVPRTSRRNSAKLPGIGARPFQGGLLNQPPADQGEAAQGHAMAVEVEELIVQHMDHLQPELGECLGRHPGLGLLEQCRVDPHAAQVGIALGGRSRKAWSMALRKYTATESLSRMAGFHCLCWVAKMPGLLNRSGIGQAWAVA